MCYRFSVFCDIKTNKQIGEGGEGGKGGGGEGGDTGERDNGEH